MFLFWRGREFSLLLFCYNTVMTQEEFLTRLSQVVENQKQDIESVKFEIMLEVLNRVNTGNYSNKEDLVNLIKDFFSNSIDTYLQNAWQKFNSKQFYLYNNQGGFESLNISPGLCFSDGNFLLVVDDIKRIYCTVTLIDGQYFEETLLFVLKMVYENVLREELLPVLESLIEQNATISQ